MASVTSPARPQRSPRKPPTTPVEFNFRTSNRGQDRTKALAWRRSLKGRTFHFFDLPAEIRNRIYECLCAGRMIQISCKADYGVPGPHVRCIKSKRSDHRQPGLARACRQARQELLPFFYARNMFRLMCRRQLGFFQKWMHAISHHHKHLRRIRFVSDWPAQMNYTVDVLYNDHVGVLEDAIKLRILPGFSARAAIYLARKVAAVLSECSLALHTGQVAANEVGGYALIRIVKELTQKPFGPPLLANPAFYSSVVGQQVHHLIYPELRSLDPDAL